MFHADFVLSVDWISALSSWVLNGLFRSLLMKYFRYGSHKSLQAFLNRLGGMHVCVHKCERKLEMCERRRSRIQIRKRKKKKTAHIFEFYNPQVFTKAPFIWLCPLNLTNSPPRPRLWQSPFAVSLNGLQIQYTVNFSDTMYSQRLPDNSER